MSGRLSSVEDVARSIERGEVLLVAGETHLLRRLPRGRWIGGSIPYLVPEAGTAGRDLLHVTRLPDCVSAVTTRVYDRESIREVYSDVSGRSFGVVIIPASCPTHLEFALHAPSYRDFAVRPLVGWIAGMHLEDLAEERPSVFCGGCGQEVEDGAVVMQVTLPPTHAADVHVVNIFEQGDGEAITFPTDGFDVTTALIDGVPTDFAEYIEAHHLDTRLPLVADYYGVMVNVSFQAVDLPGRSVRLYSPVFAGLTYRHAKPVDDYALEFVSHLPEGSADEPAFSCNCVLNYFYSEAPAQHLAAVRGPLTFGEVAYQLLNQTMVYLTIHELGSPARHLG
jgi:hypothetical protein